METQPRTSPKLVTPSEAVGPFASAPVYISITPPIEKSPYSGLAGPWITRVALMAPGDRILQSA